MIRFVLAPLCSLTLACGLLLLAVPDAQAQRGQQRAPAARQPAPAPSAGGQAVQPRRPGRSNPVGTKLPSYAEPSSPPAIGQSPGGATPPGEQAQTNAPGTPSDPTQAPLGGAEYLAAAGAAYALNRLRKNGSDEDEDESEEA